MQQYKVITSNQCIKCSMLVGFLQQGDVNFIEESCDSDEALKFINEHNINSLPILIDLEQPDRYITGFNPINTRKFLGGVQ